MELIERTAKARKDNLFTYVIIYNCINACEVESSWPKAYREGPKFRVVWYGLGKLKDRHNQDLYLREVYVE